MTQAVWLTDEGDTKSAGRNSTYTAVWQTTGYSTNLQRRQAIINNPNFLPEVTTVDDYLLDNLEWDYQRQEKLHRKVVITYTHQSSGQNKSQNKVLQNVGDEETQISFSSQEIPVTEAIFQSAKGNSPDMGTSIEYNRQTQEVKGTRKRRLVSRLNITKIYDKEEITNAWIVERENKLFTINTAAFRGRDPETVMFVGMDIRQRSVQGDWIVSFVFEYIPKETKDLSKLDIDAGGTIDIFPYKYYWALYEEEENTADNVLVPKAKGFYEATIYEISDFSTII